MMSVYIIEAELLRSAPNYYAQQSQYYEQPTLPRTPHPIQY